MSSPAAESVATRFPEPFPATWASDWGEDGVGLWMALTFRSARQAFRWIMPGTFLMGSPETEAERYSDEVQHEVTLSRGFWLADTACTQAFWQAVNGKNPSHFTEDPRNPVEQVSWEDAERLIDELNARVPGLEARLPSESEWEYACRAGTGTAFSFGERITPEEVNYDGNYPYAGGRKGLYRQRTVPVGSLPANPWGLYEMHGNVWEWCADWYGDYPSGSQIDPRGSDKGAFRVLRGGSWISLGGYVRSADRYRLEPGIRYLNVGFRLALGGAASTRGKRESEPRAAGQPRGRRGGQVDRAGNG